jgi:O-antigen ligase
MVAVGAVYVIVSPVRLTALYAFRTLYEPALLLLAIVVLARTRGLPPRLVGLAATAFVASATLAALYVWPQVYLLGFRYLNTFYTNPGQRLHWSYLANGINQPRGIGTMNSPNEYGAVLAIAMIVLAVPNLVRLPGWARTWLFVACALALLLSFSRSGMLSAVVGLVVLVLLARDHWPSFGRRVKLPARRIASFATPVLVGLALTTWVFTTSGAPKLVQETVAGTEPSAQGRPASVRQGVSVVVTNPLGLGLGTAGPKAARFGEQASPNRILTETWYLVYAIQVGILGLAVLLATALVILAGLWRSRASPLSRASIAMAVGLGAGALFIPIIDEPTVFTPLWSFCALALAAAREWAPAEARASVAAPVGATQPGHAEIAPG